MVQFKLLVGILGALFCLTSCASTGPLSTGPKMIRSFPQQYPYSAKTNKIEGRITLRFVVTTDGIARDAEVVESLPDGVFDEAALAAIKRFLFKPGTKAGKPVDTAMNLTFVYSIEGERQFVKIVDD